MSQIITFYSYKGGVGRTMALANISVILSQWGYKTLIVDWDLEAPGLEFYFKDFIDPAKVSEKEGVIDILTSCEENIKSWQESLTPISVPQGKEPIHLLTSGKRGKNYLNHVRDFDIDYFYEQINGGEKIESLRNQWKDAYDFILIDSRTGITDNGGICTIQLPDVLVLLFTATDQGFNGIVDVSERALKAQQNIPFDRQKLISLPIPSRFDTNTEFKISQNWLDKFAKGLKNIYRDWLPMTLQPRQILEITKIPYVTYFSFGEKLPVVEQGVNDPTSIGYSYESIAAILANNFNKVEYLLEDRDEFINLATRDKKRTMKNKNKNKVKIFVSYSRSNSIMKKKLENYLSILERQDSVELLSDDQILPGMDWREIIDESIENSQVYLILLSSDYIKSPYLNEELKAIYNNHNKKKDSFIIPIIIDKSDWHNTFPVLSKYQALPRDGKAISLLNDQDAALHEITNELQRLITYIDTKSNI